MINQSNTQHSFTMISGDHDGGLEHNHHWARERSASQNAQPFADASAARTPSCAVHDDAIYAAH